MKMALCKSVHGRWNYCPFDALKILGTDMQYGEGGYLCREAALDAAQRDKTIPKGASFVDVTDWGPREPVVTLADRLRAAGFAIWESGGGCTAWRAPLAGGGYILITDEDGAAHDVTDRLIIGVYDADDVTIALAHGNAEALT